MNKYSNILLLVGFSLVLAGCNFNTGQNTSTQTPNQSQTNQTAFDLKSALSRGESLKCTYTTDQGTMTSLIKGKKVRVEGAMFGSQNNGNGGMINDGENIYIWNNQDKQGTKYKLSALPSPTDNPQNQGVNQMKDAEKWAAEVQSKYKVDCQPGSINDNQFVPPSDISFQDMTQALDKMKELQKSLPSFNPGQIPSGLPQGIQE